MDDSNGDFEVVEKFSSLTCTSQSASPNTSMLTNIPPPSALPTFITAQTPSSSISDKVTSPHSEISHTSRPLPSSSQPVKSVSSIPSPGSFVKPPNAPVTNQPLPPTSSSTEHSEDVDSRSKAVEGVGSPPEGDGWMGWIKGTVQSVGHKVAEKAKSSMDTMITTLDPQMKDFINSGGDIDIIVASDKEVKVNPIKEAFQKIFGKATVSGYDSQAGEIAAQPVGFEFAVKSAEERINNLRSSGKIHPQQPVVAIENFIVPFMSDCWVEIGVLLLNDTWHDIILQTFTQPIPIPGKFIEDLKSSTPDHYPQKESGFAKTIGQIASEHLHVHHTMWQESLTGIPRREYILMAAKVLAELYRARLPSDVI